MSRDRCFEVMLSWLLIFAVDLSLAISGPLKSCWPSHIKAEVNKIGYYPLRASGRREPEENGHRLR